MENHIPVTVPEEISLGYNVSESILKNNKIRYHQLTDTISIGSIAIDTTKHPKTTIRLKCMV